MTDLSELLVPEAVLAGVTAGNKKALFQQLGAAASQVYGLDARDIAERLAARERLGSTGFGGGIAIPHGRLDSLPRVQGLFVRLAQPIDFGAIDDLPVDLVFMLLSPTAAGAEHLKALASVSRRLRDRPFAEKLRGAGSPDAIYALLMGVEARDAA
jgi:nitrogen PTS system EIIA component